MNVRYIRKEELDAKKVGHKIYEKYIDLRSEQLKMLRTNNNEEK